MERSSELAVPVARNWLLVECPLLVTVLWNWISTAPVLGPHEATIRGWLVADLSAPRKQRHTARRVWQRLLDEQGAVVAESSVRHLVAQLRVEIDGGRAQVMVPQTHRAAEEAEVDFGEFQAVIAGVVRAREGFFEAGAKPSQGV